MSNTLNSVTLPPGLTWNDRHTWSPVAQEVAVTVGGELVIHTAVRQGGRPITLAGDAESAWFDQETADALQALADQAGAEMTLTWEGATFTVLFRHQDLPALELKPIWRQPARYAGVIKLMEV